MDSRQIIVFTIGLLHKHECLNSPKHPCFCKGEDSADSPGSSFYLSKRKLAGQIIVTMKPQTINASDGQPKQRSGGNYASDLEGCPLHLIVARFSLLFRAVHPENCQCNGPNSPPEIRLLLAD